MGREAEHREAEDPVARLHVGNAFADCLDDASHFVAEDPRVRRFRWIEGERLEHIAEIHPRGHHFDDHLPCTARRQLERHQAQRV